MNTKFLTYFLSGFLLLSGITGCKKEVQVGAPVTQLVTTSVFNDDNTATAATLSIYSQMIANTFPWNLHRITALSSDELTNYATDPTSMDLYKNGLSASTDANSISIWYPVYNFMYQANAILENLQGSVKISSKVKQQLTGEAAFMRAYFYFYLVNLYGDVPLITSTDYKVNATIARTPKAQVYQQVIKDLTKAQSELNSSYVDATDTAITTDHIRPTSWAAKALMARVYLYTANYDSAELQATAVINNTSFQLPTDLAKVFLKNSSEAIWQLDNDATAFWTTDGADFILSAPPSSSSINSATISPQLMSAFEAGDQRKVAWVNNYTDGNNIWYFPYKYRDNYTASVVTEYTMMLRLAEQYLIRAEARAQQGNTNGALTDINIIRKRAGLGDYSGLTDKSSLLAAIAHERQVELFTEGDRWIDLKRTKNIDAVMDNPGGVCAAKGGVWDINQELYPILISDILNNSNLVQNLGY
jgi:hypothetical protein